MLTTAVVSLSPTAGNSNASIHRSPSKYCHPRSKTRKKKGEKSSSISTRRTHTVLGTVGGTIYPASRLGGGGCTCSSPVTHGFSQVYPMRRRSICRKHPPFSPQTPGYGSEPYAPDSSRQSRWASRATMSPPPQPPSAYVKHRPFAVDHSVVSAT